MQNALFGYTGFVGTWLLNQFDCDALFNSKNYEQATGKTFQNVFFAGLSAAKWMVNANPVADWKNIENVMAVLQTLTVTQKFVLISTIDVSDATHAYGRHRRHFEEFIQAQFPTHFIVRLPALFGRGLKKNVLYDLLHDNQVEKIAAHSSFQWYDLKWLKDDIEKMVGGNERAINLLSEPIPTWMIVSTWFPQHSAKINQTASGAQYNFTSPQLLRSQTEVLAAMAQFIFEESSTVPFQLGVAAIGATVETAKTSETSETSHWLQRYLGAMRWHGIDYCEMAPTLLVRERDWAQVTTKLLQLTPSIYSFQSVTFGIPWNLFTNEQNLLAHLHRVINIAIGANVKILVFGCPKTRWVPEGLAPEIAEQRALSFFRRLGDFSNEIIICIENNSAQYGCNFLTTPQSVASFVRRVNHPNVQMMLDVGNAAMEGETQETICAFLCENVDILHHVHASEPQMGPLQNKALHCGVATTLKAINYCKGITMEMLPPSSFSMFQSSVSNFRAWYAA